jgi:hypothetical protein
VPGIAPAKCPHEWCNATRPLRGLYLLPQARRLWGRGEPVGPPRQTHPRRRRGPPFGLLTPRPDPRPQPRAPRRALPLRAPHLGGAGALPEGHTTPPAARSGCSTARATRRARPRSPPTRPRPWTASDYRKRLRLTGRHPGRGERDSTMTRTCRATEKPSSSAAQVAEQGTPIDAYQEWGHSGTMPAMSQKLVGIVSARDLLGAYTASPE